MNQTILSWQKSWFGFSERCYAKTQANFLANAMFDMELPGSSACKDSACNAGGPSSIPELGNSPGEGIGCPLQYSWASLVAQMVKNPPAMRETWVLSLIWEVPLQGEHGKPFQYSCLEDPQGERSLAGQSPWGHKQAQHLWDIIRAKYFNCCLVTKSCLTLCDPMDCSTPGFPVLHYLLEFSIH